MNQMEEEDWCQMDKSSFVKDDCLLSSLPSSDSQRYADHCGRSGDFCPEVHCLLQSSKTEAATFEYGNIISDDNMINLDGITMPLGTLGKQLNLASNLFDIKIQLNNNYPNASETLSLNYSNSPSSSNLESNEILQSLSTTDQSLPEEEECHVELKAYAKTRQKMHEMAVKQKLITEQDPKGHGFLCLSSEEKRALLHEGYKLPTMLPLTESEEDALKVIRRKIKNKLSAQESRRKRKEYMNALEKRIQYYRAENSTLKLKLRDLEQRNRSLLIDLRSFKTDHSTKYHLSCLTPSD
uniref:BZIP domain-containing protein n=1 Tax=Elaeophora elaphi TaxID=1147741 RepID=A0A0R3S3N8_9BILA